MGQFLIDESFLIGPAIDEAASMADQAQGAFVWLSPAAQAVVEAVRSLHEGMEREVKAREDEAEIPFLYDLVLDYPVPLKDIGALRTSVVNPFIFLDDPNCALVRERMVSSFGNPPASLKVAAKLQNTDTFLAEALLRAKGSRHLAGMYAEASDSLTGKSGCP